MSHSPLKIAHQTVYFQSAEKMEQIDDETITLICTSPPYWNVRDYGFDEQIGFRQSYQEYVDSLNSVWKECIRVLQPNGKMAINLQPLPISSDKSGFNRRIIQDIMFDVQKFMLNHDMFLSGMNIWDKAPYINNVSWGSYPKPTNIATNTAFEQIYTFVKRGKTRNVNKDLQEKSKLSKEEWRHWAVRMIWDDISPVIKINQKGENLFGHSAPFPEDIPYRLIRMHTIEQELVLDPFLGSGTTLKICRVLNRRGIGFEINPEFRDLVKSRILESWDPPKIDSQYKTLSSQDLTEIITQAVRKSLNLVQKVAKETDSQVKFEDDDAFIKNVTPSIFKMLEAKGILTKANIRKIKKNLSRC